MAQEVFSIFIVTEYKTGERWEEAVKGHSQEAISKLRGLYPRFSKFVLDGFEIDGNFTPLYIKS